MTSAVIDLLTARCRWLTAVGWRSRIIAVAVLATAVAVIFTFSGTSPVTARLFFSASGSNAEGLKDVIVSSDIKKGNSTADELAAPPLDSEDAIIISDREMVNFAAGELAAPPLDSEDAIIVSDTNKENSTADEFDAASLDSEDLFNSTEKLPSNETPINTNLTFLPPPPPDESFDEGKEKSNAVNLEIPPLESEPPKNSESNEVKSGSGGLNAPPLLSEAPISFRETDRQLLYAKKEIDQPPEISDDPDLYAPLFKNVSVFKRSYELMESILKVYIYRDGKRPIFHTPALKGIYASEGWFLKLMEANIKFVVKDPKKAHLFYLPYSARQVQVTLFKPELHNLEALAIFVKNYVDFISAKYPFWNRTRGADHFLVACHDWGPDITRLHEELSKYTIRALCNADLSEDFVRGKDVSLPETLIINPKKPLRALGGKPISKRSILAFFAGQMHGRVRPVLVNQWSGKDQEMKIYGPLPHEISKKMSYAQHMKSSKFCICPMGYEVNSPRIVEAIYYECVPVIIADNFALPFDDVLDWSGFSVVVAEKDIPNLKDLLLKISLREYVAMYENVKRVQRHFLWHSRPEKYDIFHMILHSVWFNRINLIQAD